MSTCSGRHKASQNDTEQLGQILLSRSILQIATAIFEIRSSARYATFAPSFLPWQLYR